jgi:Uma2 family endonuclease
MKQPAENPAKLVTVSEFYRLVPDGQKADLLDGVIYMASPDTRTSDKLGGFLRSLIEDYAVARNLGGDVFGPRFSFRLTKYRAPEPDAAYVCRERLHLVTEREMKGPPDIAVEIVSRDSRKRDYGPKKEIYEATGVRQYWIIDPLKGRAEFHRLVYGKLQIVSTDDGFFRSEVLPGFWLRVEWLFSDPIPNRLKCLNQMLAGPAPPAGG